MLTVTPMAVGGQSPLTIYLCACALFELSGVLPDRFDTSTHPVLR